MGSGNNAPRPETQGVQKLGEHGRRPETDTDLDRSGRGDLRWGLSDAEKKPCTEMRGLEPGMGCMAPFIRHASISDAG
jgi:hypothetical protein